MRLQRQIFLFSLALCSASCHAVLGLSEFEKVSFSQADAADSTTDSVYDQGETTHGDGTVISDVSDSVIDMADSVLTEVLIDSLISDADLGTDSGYVVPKQVFNQCNSILASPAKLLSRQTATGTRRLAADTEVQFFFLQETIAYVIVQEEAKQLRKFAFHYASGGGPSQTYSTADSFSKSSILTAQPDLSLTTAALGQINLTTQPVLFSLPQNASGTVSFSPILSTVTPNIVYAKQHLSQGLLSVLYEAEAAANKKLYYAIRPMSSSELVSATEIDSTPYAISNLHMARVQGGLLHAYGERASGTETTLLHYSIPAASLPSKRNVATCSPGECATLGIQPYGNGLFSVAYRVQNGIRMGLVSTQNLATFTLDELTLHELSSEQRHQYYQAYPQVSGKFMSIFSSSSALAPLPNQLSATIIDVEKQKILLQRPLRKPAQGASIGNGQLVLYKLATDESKMEFSAIWTETQSDEAGLFDSLYYDSFVCTP